MRIDDLRERYASIARLNLLPEKFTATVESIKERKDAKYPTYDAMYIRAKITDKEVVQSVNGDTVIQKFRPMHVTELLVPAMEKLGIRDTKDLMGKTFIFTAQSPSFGGSNPRWVPVGVPNGKQVRGKSTKKSAN